MTEPMRLALGGMIALATGFGVGRFVYTPILPIMAEGAGLSAAEVGLIASLNMFGYLLGALLAARSSLPGTRRAWLIGALAVSGASMAAMSLGETMPAFVGLRLVGGMASAFVMVFASTLVLDRLTEAGYGNLSTVHFAGIGTGIAVAAGMVALLLAAGSGWQGLWVGAGLLNLAGALAVAWLVRGMHARAPARPEVAPSTGGEGFPFLVAAYGLYGFGFIISATFMVAIVRAAPETAPLEPVIWVLFGLIAIPSVPIWTWIGRRIGNVLAFSLTCVMAAAGVAANVLWVTIAGALVAAVLVGGSFMGATALGLIAGRRLSLGDPRRTLGRMTAAFGLGQVTAPALAGLARDYTGSYVLPSLLAAAGLLLAAGLIFRVRFPDETASGLAAAHPVRNDAPSPPLPR